jgi:hypothetical protein
MQFHITRIKILTVADSVGKTTADFTDISQRFFE